MSTTTAAGKPRRTDFTLIVLALALTCLGILAVFDASYSYAMQMHYSVYKFVGQQALWGALGIAAMIWAMRWPYWNWRGLAVYGVSISLVLLIAVFVPHIGIKANGAHRWIGFGAIRFQPSELAKLAVVIYVARLCAGQTKLMRNFQVGVLPPLFVIVLLAGAIVVEPDLGTCIVVLGGGLATLFFAGMRKKHLFATLGVLLLFGAAFLGAECLKSHSSFQVTRLIVFLNPDKYKQGVGYQVYHSTLALGSGGVVGLGIGEGREKLYLPESYTDFIYAIIGEEGGLIASLAVLLLLALLVARGFHIAATTKDSFGILLAGGIATVIGLQTFMNIGVDTSSIPATGVPLPFVSYGGSSLFLTLLMVGILLNIAKNPEGDPAKKELEQERVAEREFELRWNRGATLSRPEYRERSGYGVGTAAEAYTATAPKGRR